MTLGHVIALLRQHWPTLGNRSAVVHGYKVLASQHPRTLADIALRNNVFSPAPATSELELAIAEGRRRAALEIIRLANIEPAALQALLETKPTERGERR